MFLIVKSEFLFTFGELSNPVTGKIFFFCFAYGDMKPLKTALKVAVD